jgi:hypothetical protein
LEYHGNYFLYLSLLLGKDPGAKVNGGCIDDFGLKRLLRLSDQCGGEPLLQLTIGLFDDDGGALLGVGQGEALSHEKPG